MMDYLVDENLDIVIPLQKVTNISDLLFQQVRLLLRTWTGDFLYDITEGMPYADKILAGDVDATELERIYYDKISSLQGFKSLENFSIEVENRNILISFDVISTNGDLQSFSQGA